MLTKEQKSNFEEKIICHEQYLYRMALSLIQDQDKAKDLVQQAFIKAYENWDKFKYIIDKDCKSWVSKILMNEFLNMYRADKHYLNISLNLGELDSYLNYKRPLILGENLRPDQVLRAKTLYNDTKKAIEELPNHYKTVMLLYLLEDRPYEDIATILEININTVKSKIHRAKKIIQRKLKEYKSR